MKYMQEELHKTDASFQISDSWIINLEGVQWNPTMRLGMLQTLLQSPAARLC
jgi:hypothetical protein